MVKKFLQTPSIAGCCCSSLRLSLIMISLALSPVWCSESAGLEDPFGVGTSPMLPTSRSVKLQTISSGGTGVLTPPAAPDDGGEIAAEVSLLPSDHRPCLGSSRSDFPKSWDFCFNAPLAVGQVFTWITNVVDVDQSILATWRWTVSKPGDVARNTVTLELVSEGTIL